MSMQRTASQPAICFVSVCHLPFNRAAVKKIIIDSARKLFNRYGFENVSLHQIMSGAGGQGQTSRVLTAMQSIAQRALIAVGLLCALCWDPAPAHANDPASSSGSIYDGQWSCEFRLVTKPGGTFVTFLNHAQLENVLFTAIKSSFQVNKNGSFSWEEHQLPHRRCLLPDRKL
jgi:hypothetical protein